MESVEKEIDKLLNKFNDFDKRTALVIDECLSQINKIRQELNEGKFSLVMSCVTMRVRFILRDNLSGQCCAFRPLFVEDPTLFFTVCHST